MKLLNILNTKTTVFWVILTLLLSIPAFTTLLQPGYFGMHDDLQIMRIYEMDKCLKDGQLPCRWVPDMGYGYGYPLFNFYPVMPYYLGEFVHLLGFNLIWSVKIDFILSFLVSAVTMFFLARIFWGNMGGFLSAIFYVYAPYHAVDVYVRGAMAEGWSVAWAPLVFLAIYRVIKDTKITNMMLLSVSLALFLTSHNPLALIFSPIMAVWALILMFQNKKWKAIPFLIVSGVWALGLAAFFTVPVLLEGKLVHLETLFIGYFNYLAHFIDLKQMFTSTFWGYGGSEWGPGDSMSFQIGYLHTGAIILSLVTAVFMWWKNKSLTVILLFMAAVFLFSAFLMHSKSNFIWEIITILQNIQFPWRILSITIFVSSFVAGSIVLLPFNKQLRIGCVVLLLFLIGFFYQKYFTIEKPIPLTDQEKLSGALWDLQRTAGIFDYLPKTAQLPPGKPALETVEVSSGSAMIKDFKRGTNWLSFNVESTMGTTLKLPIYYFPNWKISVDKVDTSFDYKNELGQPVFKVETGNYSIYAKLHNTFARTAANTVSLLSFIALVVLLIRQINKTKESVKHSNKKDVRS